MVRRAVVVAGLLAAFAGAGMGFVQPEKPKQDEKPKQAEKPAEASPAQKAFEKVKALEGTWEMTDEKGKTQIGSVYSVTSAGSAVREVMFPGQPHEMTNMYHLDGDKLMATHYCAVGNQPRMVCTDFSKGDTLSFKVQDVTNMPDPKAAHMANLTLVMADHDHLVQKWESIDKGEVQEKVEFELKRVAGDAQKDAKETKMEKTESKPEKKKGS